MSYNYRQHLLGMFYALLNNTAPEIGSRLHYTGYFAGFPKYKFYTHNLLPTNAAYNPEGMVSLNNDWEYWFATADPQVLAIIEHSTSLLNVLSFGNHTLAIKKVTRIPLRKNGGLFRCVAPITIKRQRQNGYLTPDDPDFEAAVVTSLKNRYRAWTGRETTVEFRFIEPRRRLEHYRQGKILSFSGKIFLQATQDVIQFAQLVGLGQKNSLGMGMIT